MDVRVPNTEHTSRPWRIHEITPDFRVEDVWVPPGGGRRDDFATGIELITSYDPAHSTSFAVRNLFNNPYQEPLSFIDEPGRTYAFAFKREFLSSLFEPHKERAP